VKKSSLTKTVKNGGNISLMKQTKEAETGKTEFYKRKQNRNYCIKFLGSRNVNAYYVREDSLFRVKVQRPFGSNEDCAVEDSIPNIPSHFCAQIQLDVVSQ
jgi:hypothetical protein